MKKIKIAGVLTILVIIVNLIFSLGDFGRDAKEGFQAGRDDSGMRCHLDVALSGVASDSVYHLNATAGGIVPVVSQVGVDVAVPVWLHLFWPFILVASIAYLLGFISLIKMLIKVSRKQVFAWKNVHYLRFFAYSQAAIYSIMWMFHSLIAHYALEQVQIPGYEILRGSDMGIDWTLVMITILFAEVFAVGVKIKEEQDLTV